LTRHSWTITKPPIQHLQIIDLTFDILISITEFLRQRRSPIENLSVITRAIDNNGVDVLRQEVPR
jgi:hypothetical protein